MAITGFRDLVVDSCKKLTRDHGFSLRVGDDSYVAFESDSVVISFAYDRNRAYELNVGVASKSMEDAGIIPYNLGDVMRQFDVPRSKERSYLQSSSMERIAEFVSDACEALIEYCQPILEGDPAAFEQVRTRRAVESKRYTLEVGLKGIRKEVEEAWQTKDYVKYCRLLAGFESVLSESEKKKLEFAASK